MSVSNEQYLNALKKTQNIFGTESQGFISEGASLTNICKQLNTIIQLQIQLDTRLNVLEQKIEKIKGLGPTDLDRSIEELSSQLSGLRTGDKPLSKEKGKLKAVSNPFELLKRIS